MTLHEYLQGMKGKTAAVIGLGVSNRPLVELLARNGVKVIACDRKERAALGGAAAHYEALGAVLHLGEGYLRDLDADVVFRTPGMRPDVPELLEAKAHGAVITSEMEAFFAVCPCPILGVTGSDGKTTTASVIAELLKAEGRRVWLGGNIGRPLLADAEQMTPDDLAVLELSSFQLMDMPYSPQVAVLTNLAPNHLDVHRDMAEYIASKENIYLHQSTRDTAIFNADNAITRNLSGKAVGRARLFSRQEEVADGAFVRGGAIWLRDAAGEREVLPLADIRLPGWHNVENYMAALLAVDGLVRDETVRRVAQEFAGVEHRIEFVRELHGVRYYNDSIATSPTRTIAGLRAFPHKVVLIAGRGPLLHIKMQSVGSSSAHFENAFASAGINQTRHEIRLVVDVYVSVLLPGFSTVTKVTNRCAVAETVIVGSVPDTYTYFDTREDMSSTAEDFIMNNAG